MSERDGQPTRRVRGRGRERNRQGSEPDDIQPDLPYGSPVRIPPGRASTSSCTPTPPYDPRWTLPSADQHIFSGGDPYTTFSTPHLGEQSAAVPPDVSFFQTYGTSMPFNHNLFLSLARAGQQRTSEQQSQPVDEPITGVVVRNQRHSSQPPHSHCSTTVSYIAEHLKRWEEYRNSQQGTTETSPGMPLSETDIWVQANLNNKGRVYGFGAEGVVMKQRARHSFSTTRSSSVNNYDPREMAQRFNESVQKAAEEARSQLRQELEVELTAKIKAQLNDEWNQREATLKKSLDKDKVAMKKTVSTAVQKATKKLWKFFSTQVAGSSSKPPPQLDLADDDEDEDADEDEDEDEDDDETQM